MTRNEAIKAVEQIQAIKWMTLEHMRASYEYSEDIWREASKAWVALDKAENALTKVIKGEDARLEEDE